MFFHCPPSSCLVDPVLWIVYNLWSYDLLPTHLFSPLRMAKMTDPLCWAGPGLNLAQTSVWLTCAMSLAVFDIEKYVDAFGNVVEPGIHYLGKIIK